MHKNDLICWIVTGVLFVVFLLGSFHLANEYSIVATKAKTEIELKKLSLMGGSHA